jgi:O-antigen/teichoic acid export membrane protein
MLPALARARDDAAAFREVYLGFQRLIAVVMFPVSAGLVATGGLVMYLLGGPDWRQAGPVLEVLAITLSVQGFVNTASSAFAAIGRADKLFYASILFAAVMSIVCFAVIVTAEHDPSLATRLAVWYSATTVALFIPYQAYCLRSVGISIGDWLRVVRKGLIASLAMWFLLFVAQRRLTLLVVGSERVYYTTEPALVFALLAAEVALGVVLYVIFAWPECRWLWGQIRNRGNDTSP